MLGRIRFRPIGWLTALCTLAALAATMVLAAPGGAATERPYETETTAECVLAPGVLNEPGTVTIKARGEGPSTVARGEQFALKNSTITITIPGKWAENLEGIGVRQIRGSVNGVEVEVEGGTPSSLNIAKPPEFPSGLPFKGPAGTTFTAPTEGGFLAGPVTVTGKEHLVMRLSAAAGFKKIGETGENKPIFESTHGGFQFELSGYSEPEPGKFEKIIGPLEVACTEPKASTLAEVAIVGEVTTTTSSSPTTTTTTSAGTTTTTTTTHTPCDLCPGLNDKLTGSVTVLKLGQPITLPEGCTFRGPAEIPGLFEANTTCPSFTSGFKLFNILPVSLRLSLVESEPARGALTPEESAGRSVIHMTGTIKENIEITRLGVLGLSVPVGCKTAEPAVFGLNSSNTAAELLRTGATSSGLTTLPAVQCSGPLGGIGGLFFSALVSGPNNPYTLTIAP
jgi:hypothetical protein